MIISLHKYRSVSQHGILITMGYTTYFLGEFSISPGLADNHAAYLKAFCLGRHMKRDITKIPNDRLVETCRSKVNLDCGREGEFCINEAGFRGQERDPSVIDFNQPPEVIPSLWCGWIPNETNDKLIWDGEEKFYNYIDWQVYLIEQFFAPWGYSLVGSMRWEGECGCMDTGVIKIIDNKITVYTHGKLDYGSSSNCGFIIGKINIEQDFRQFKLN